MRTKTPPKTTPHEFSAEGPFAQQFLSTPTSVYDFCLSLKDSGQLLHVYWTEAQRGARPDKFGRSILKGDNEYFRSKIRWSKDRFYKHKKILQKMRFIRTWAWRNKETGNVIKWMTSIDTMAVNEEATRILVYQSLDIQESISFNKLKENKVPVKDSQVYSDTVLEGSQNKKTSKPTYKFDQKHEELSRWYLEQQVINNPSLLKQKDITKKTIHQGADTIEKLERIDDHDFLTEILPAIEWSSDHPKWSKWVLRCTGLRNKSNNGNTKFINLLSQYLEEHQTNNPVCSYPKKFIEPFESFLDVQDSRSRTKLYAGIKTLMDYHDQIHFLSKENPQFGRIRTPEMLCQRYLQWLEEDCEWIDVRTANLFFAENQVFHQFIKYVEQYILMETIDMEKRDAKR